MIPRSICYLYVVCFKYSAPKMDTCLDEDEDPISVPLLRTNHELRHRLHDEAAAYRRRLDTYRQAQQHQAALVSRLQAKVRKISACRSRFCNSFIFVK